MTDGWWPVYMRCTPQKHFRLQCGFTVVRSGNALCSYSHTTQHTYNCTHEWSQDHQLCDYVSTWLSSHEPACSTYYTIYKATRISYLSRLAMCVYSASKGALCCELWLIPSISQHPKQCFIIRAVARNQTPLQHSTWRDVGVSIGNSMQRTLVYRAWVRNIH